MSTTYKVVAGDTLARIARKVYGCEAEAARLSQANPGVVEPLTPGTVLTVLPLPNLIADSFAPIPAATESEVAIMIDGQRYRFWERIRITRALDRMDTLTMSAPFDITLPGFKDIFRPFSFKPIVVMVGGEVLFTGTLVAIEPAMDHHHKTVTVSGYARPGVLHDCTAPASAYPLEFNLQGLRDIATTLAAPFGLAVDFQTEQGAVFERVALDPGKKILAFLIDLAQQRGILIASTTTGALQFSRPPSPGQTVAVLRTGRAPVLSVTPSFSAQNYYSHITGIESVVVGLAGSQFTVRNPHVAGVLRPFTFEVTDTDTASVKATVEAKAGRMFANGVSYRISVATWRTPAGALWAPNTRVLLHAPDAMVYRDYECLIRAVEFTREPSGEVATLDLILPGSLSGHQPAVLPWDD